MRTWIFIGCLLAGVSGCFNDGDSTAGQSVALGGGNNSTLAVSGVLMKGAIANAEITVHIPDANGAVGARIAGPFKTDANGQWSGQLPLGSSGILLVRSSGGVYTDEASGQSVSISTNFGFISILDLDAGNQVALTPWSYATYLAAQAGMISTFTVAAREAIQGATGSLGFNPVTTLLQDPAGSQATATTQEKTYAALTAAFSQLHKNEALRLSAFNNASPFAVILAFAEDISDGRLNGVDAAGNAVLILTGQGGGTVTEALVPLSPSGLSVLRTAAEGFVAATAALNSVTIDPNLHFSIVIQN